MAELIETKVKVRWPNGYEAFYSQTMAKRLKDKGEAEILAEQKAADPVAKAERPAAVIVRKGARE